MDNERKAAIVALVLRVTGYTCITVGVVASPLDGALIVVGGASLLEGLLIEADLR